MDLSVVCGPPLSAEPGLGALTLPGFLREVTAAYAGREALVLSATRWTYADLWEHAVEVARALRACGVGKDGRVGVLMTNRPEWVAAVFGVSLAGGVAVTLSTFSTPDELGHLLAVAGVSVLLFERTVLKKDFAAILAGLEPRIGDDGPLRSARYPFLRHLAMIGEAVPGIETWEAFLARGQAEPRELVEATAAAVRPSDPAVLFFSSGTASRPKGILSAHRGVAIQLWRFPPNVRGRPGGPRPLLDGQRAVLVGQFRHGVRYLPGERRCARAPAGVRRPAGSRADGGRTGELPAGLAAPVGATRGGARLAACRPEQHAVRGCQHSYRAASHCFGPLDRARACLRQHRDLHDHHLLSGQHPTRGARRQQRRGPAGRDPQDHRPADRRGGPVRRPRRDLRQGSHAHAGLPGHAAGRNARPRGLFPTGDGGYLDRQGRLFWEGRLTDIIKTGGANVSPREVDEALAGYPGVEVTQTVGVPHETLGEIVVACVVPHEGVSLEAEEIRSFLRERLASYKVPRRVLFFRPDEITLTGSAKIKTSDLRDLAAKALATTP